MDKQVFRSSEAPAWKDPVAPATMWRDLLFLSGEIGVDPETMEPVPGGIQSQTRQALKNLEATLREAGSSLQHVLKVNAYLGEPKDFDDFNEVFSQEFPSLPPARTTVGVTLLGDYAIELDLIAYVPTA